MHQRPELHEVVLERSSGDQQPPSAVEIQQRLPALAFPVLDHVGLVKYEILPFFPPEHLGVLRAATLTLSLLMLDFSRGLESIQHEANVTIAYKNGIVC